MLGFKFISDNEYTEDASFVVFEINGELYRIWYYKNTKKKVLQKLVDDGEDVDVIECGEFE